MEEKIRQIESLEREISALEGASLEINVPTGSELHQEIKEMKKEGRKLKGSIIF